VTTNTSFADLASMASKVVEAFVKQRGARGHGRGVDAYRIGYSRRASE
jgi:hypothetical protein